MSPTESATEIKLSPQEIVEKITTEDTPRIAYLIIRGLAEIPDLKIELTKMAQEKSKKDLVIDRKRWTLCVWNDEIYDPDMKRDVESKTIILKNEENGMTFGMCVDRNFGKSYGIIGDAYIPFEKPFDLIEMVNMIKNEKKEIEKKPNMKIKVDPSSRAIHRARAKK